MSWLGLSKVSAQSFPSPVFSPLSSLMLVAFSTAWLKSQNVVSGQRPSFYVKISLSAWARNRAEEMDFNAPCKHSSVLAWCVKEKRLMHFRAKLFLEQSLPLHQSFFHLLKFLRLSQEADGTAKIWMKNPQKGGFLLYMDTPCVREFPLGPKSKTREGEQNQDSPLFLLSSIQVKKYT